MKNKIRNIAIILLLIVALLPLAACNKSSANNQTKDKDDKPAIPVEIAKVEKGTVSASYTGTTTLEAVGEAVVVAQVSGVIKKLYVEEGEQVKAGQVLAKLEDEQYIYELDQAKAKLEKLANEYKRNDELYRSKIVGLEAYERVKSEYETQKSICDLAQLNLAHTELRAPISGVISERMVKLGNMLTVNQPTYQITDFDPLWAILHVPEKELSKLKVGLTANLTADALPSKTFQGSILRTSPIISAGSGTFKVTVEVREDRKSVV